MVKYIRDKCKNYQTVIVGLFATLKFVTFFKVIVSFCNAYIKKWQVLQWDFQKKFIQFLIKLNLLDKTIDEFIMRKAMRKFMANHDVFRIQKLWGKVLPLLLLARRFVWRPWLFNVIFYFFNRETIRPAVRVQILLFVILLMQFWTQCPQMRSFWQKGTCLQTRSGMRLYVLRIIVIYRNLTGSWLFDFCLLPSWCAL